MRSYYEHLQSGSIAASQTISSHPITRTSAIFPVFERPSLSSRILFMGYWMLKRGISELLCVINLRGEKGNLVWRTTFSVKEAKTYRIEVRDLLKDAGVVTDSFIGSLEVEFYSTVNLVFPFPAVVINYYGPEFS